jgi:23S rRNA (cytidine1920-2'-O)/16S rRNA (cytidine1409-2'-O)-methyltransferase
MALITSRRLRLDEALVARGLYASRSRARDAIVRGTVLVGGALVSKPGQLIDAGAAIAIADPAQGYVSRAALKLTAGLDHFGLTPEGLTALDVGASTGGFVQLLLQRGAAHVIGVDVGHGQLHPSLASHVRVTNLEGLNARELARDHLGGRHIIPVTSDVSFISLKLALPPALEMADAGAHCVLLVKPQFEAGREAIGKGGLLKDRTLGPVIAADLSDWLSSQSGWRAIGVCDSPIEGADGNHEYLLAGIKDQ